MPAISNKNKEHFLMIVKFLVKLPQDVVLALELEYFKGRLDIYL